MQLISDPALPQVTVSLVDFAMFVCIVVFFNILAFYLLKLHKSPPSLEDIDKEQNQYGKRRYLVHYIATDSRMGRYDIWYGSVLDMNIKYMINKGFRVDVIRMLERGEDSKAAVIRATIDDVANQV